MPILVFLLFCAEVAALIGLGGVIGGWFVLLEILATGFIGYLIIKRAGRAILRSDRLIALIARPVSGIYNLGLSVVLAGLLLFLPGILTDLAGLSLLVIQLFRRRPPRRREEERVIDVEFSVQEEGRE
ncbi:hypothetical protein DRJ24_03655 [Candidatus Acetothermia bacterium]|nr:MAG: hypothetical protein DRJ24_03655 [Candidatus Acetothermia bacterium]